MQKDFDVVDVVNRLLEGEPLSKLLSDPEKDSLVGKKLSNAVCNSCGETGTLVVKDVLESDHGFYTIVGQCSSCKDMVEMEIVLKEGTDFLCDKDNLLFEGQLFTGIMEGGLMNGNYLKFNNGQQGFIVKNAAGENELVFDEPDGEFKKLNTRVTFKVISFRNGKAKLISMVNDNAGSLPAGTIFYADKAELQKYAKMAKPKQNPSMNGRFAY